MLIRVGMPPKATDIPGPRWRVLIGRDSKGRKVFRPNQHGDEPPLEGEAYGYPGPATSIMSEFEERVTFILTFALIVGLAIAGAVAMGLIR